MKITEPIFPVIIQFLISADHPGQVPATGLLPFFYHNLLNWQGFSCQIPGNLFTGDIAAQIIHMGIIFAEQLILFGISIKIIIKILKFHIGIFSHIPGEAFHSGIPLTDDLRLIRHVLGINSLLVRRYIIMECLHAIPVEPVLHLGNSSRNFPAFFLGIQIGLLIISHCVFPVLRRQVKKPVILSNHHISNLRIPKKAGIHIIIQTHQRIFEGKMILIKFLKGLWKFPKRRQTDLRKRRQFPVLIILRIKFIGKSSENHIGQYQTSCK